MKFIKGEKRSPDDLLNLLNVPAVLLPIRARFKRPIFSNWQKKTFKQSRSKAYLSELESHGNTGVLLGSPSQNLVSIDFDDPDFAERFKELNPWHSKTLRSDSQRGFNLWLVIEGDYPERVIQLKSEAGKTHGGEWRGGKGLTVIQGIHPSGTHYRITQEFPPLRLSFEDINFGGFDPRCHINDLNNLNDIKEGKELRGGNTPRRTLAEKEARSQQAREKLKSDAEIWKLYSEFIDRRYMAAQGERNSQLVAMTTFLAFNTSEKITLRLVNSFYDLNEDVFTDSKEMHSSEATSQLKNLKARWIENLSEQERELLNGFPPTQQEAFRILKNLSEIEAEDAPCGVFYLSCRGLGRRLGIDRKQAHRIFSQFQSHEVIKLLKKGQQYAPGVKAKANVYKWIFGLKAPQKPCEGL